MSKDLSLERHFFNAMSKDERKKHLREKRKQLARTQERAETLKKHIDLWEEWLGLDPITDPNATWP